MQALVTQQAVTLSWGCAGTIRGYQYTWASVTAIGLSAVLGLAVSLSTFLVIGAVGRAPPGDEPETCAPGTSSGRCRVQCLQGLIQDHICTKRICGAALAGPKLGQASC